MFDHTRTDEFIDFIAGIPAIFHPKYAVDDEQLGEIWRHVGHSFNISEKEANAQWELLSRIHRIMNDDLPPQAFYSTTTSTGSEWLEAEQALAAALSPFYRLRLDFLLTDNQQKMKAVIGLVAIVALCVLETSATLQNVTVRGIAVCNKRRLANAQVQLYDRDTLDPNDLLAEVHTNREGEFELFGSEDEIGSIEPFIRITHNCNAKPGCSRRDDYDVPKEKIGDVYDMTYVTLDIIVHGEKEIC
ncbi:unnamed protein product [Caenorhabditis auriculariae]|uniref:Transthyretin-like family protein n=1 Tax=Caenorhabditis auriculariae TaxID=2777116 RepID=A0A8S1HP37_9PELO|nr:unnamed protein product [Caenorhabditis auriculariae]